MTQTTRSIPFLVLAGGLFLAGPLAAQDFTAYSNQELFQMRDQVRYMDSSEREAYQAERQSRMQSMSQEERMSMRSDGTWGGYRSQAGNANGQGTMTRSRLRDGSGGGQGRRYGQGGGGGRRHQ